MLIPTPGKSWLKTADKGSDHGQRLLFGAPERVEGALGACEVPGRMESAADPIANNEGLIRTLFSHAGPALLDEMINLFPPIYSEPRKVHNA